MGEVPCPIPGARGSSRPEGTGSLGVLILGEALGDAEAADGLPFRPYAQAGSVLERAIRRCGYEREQFVLWNVVPVQPPRNWLEGATWEAAAIAWGRPLLEAVIHEFKPRCVLALGNVATRATTSLSGPYRGVSHLRGYPLPSGLGPSVVPSFHPSFLRRGAMPLFSVLMHDLKLAVAVGNTPLGGTSSFFSPVLSRDVAYTGRALVDPVNPVVPSGYVTHPREADAWAFLAQAEATPAGLLAYDIETPRSTEATEDESDELADTEILSIQFSLAPRTGIFMPWREPFVTVAKRMLGTPLAKAGANTYRFDDPLLEAHGCRLNGVRHDVRWMWHALQPDLRGGLQFIASFYPNDGPWKHLHASHPEYYGIMDCDVVQRILGERSTP